MESERPSNTLLALLAASLVLAGWVYGRPLLTGSDDPLDEEVVEPADLGFVDEDRPTPPEPWMPPTDPRDPFLPVELGELPTGGPVDEDVFDDDVFDEDETLDDGGIDAPVPGDASSAEGAGPPADERAITVGSDVS